MELDEELEKNKLGFTRELPDSLHRNPVSWWDLECEKALRLRKAALKKLRFSHLPSDFEDNKNFFTVAGRLFKSKKKGNFRAFVSSIHFKHGHRYVWENCRIFKDK